MKYRYHILFVILQLVLYSCHTFYSPNVDVIEPVREKGEVNASIAVAYDSYHKYQGSINWGFTNALAVNVNFVQGYRNGYKSLAMGYYKYIKDKVLFDFYAGYGQGNGYFRDYVLYPDYDDQTITGYYAKIFSNAGLHFFIDNKVQLDFNLALNSVRYYSIIINSNTKNPYIANQILNSNPYFFVEPSFRLAVFTSFGKLYVGSNYNLRSNTNYFTPYNIYTGLSLNLHQILNRKKR